MPPKSKRVFVPNLNVERKKQSTSPKPAKKENPKAKVSQSKKPFVSFKKEYIQSTGIFSEGVGKQMMASAIREETFTSSTPSPATKIQPNPNVASMMENLNEPFLADLKNDEKLQPLSYPIEKHLTAKSKSTASELIDLEKLSISDVFSNIDAYEGATFLMQFPTVFPIKIDCNAESTSAKEELASLVDLDEGYIGEISCENNSAVFQIGAVHMNLSKTSALNCAQEVHSLDITNQSISFVDNVTQTVICSPSFSQLLNTDSSDEDSICE